MGTDTIANAAVILATFAFIYRQCLISSSETDSNPDKPRLYLTIVFWHSLIITASLPVLRLLYNRWYAHIPLNWLYTNVRLIFQPGEASSIKMRYPITSFAYPTKTEMPKIEPAFFLHRFFGMGWLIAGHIALVYSWK